VNTAIPQNTEEGLFKTSCDHTDMLWIQSHVRRDGSAPVYWTALHSLRNNDKVQRT